MNSKIRNNIASVLENAGLLNDNQELLNNLDFNPFSKVLEAIESKDATSLITALTDYKNCQTELATKHEQHDRLGHLARQFQNALLEFRDGLGARLATLSTPNGDIQGQIKSVIGLTNDSAMTVLALADQQAEQFKEIRKEAEDFNKMLSKPSIDHSIRDSFLQINSRIDEIRASLEDSNQHLLMSQTFQDITGQILQRIEVFIDSVEGGLIEIVKMLASDEIDSRLQEIDKEKLSNHCTQDDVDDLLSSLGF